MTAGVVPGRKAPLLRVQGLRVEFAMSGPPVTAVASVSLEVAEGEILAVVGESGSGKSVTAMAISGLLPANARSQGSISVAGAEVLGADAGRLRRLRSRVLSVVFQNPVAALNPVFPIGCQIAEAVRMHDPSISRDNARRRAVELLRSVGMPSPEDRMHFYPHQLSGGQCQRVVIAIALASDPILLIADEPTTALDVTIQAEVLALLRSIRDTLNMSILLITHDMGVVADMADRVVVMRDGEVVESAGVEDLFAHPKAAYTRELLQAVPRIDPGPEADTTGGVAVVHLRDVEVRFSHRGTPVVTALAGVSLEVMAGTMVGVVGESGSGKSTLGRTVLGLTPTSGGTVTVLGHEISGRMRKKELRGIRKRIGVVFQSPLDALDPRQTIFESVAEPLVVHAGMRGAGLRARVAELLEAVHLRGDWGDRRPRELSGGQLQRVSIARAVALSPDLLIADEPTSALDVSVQAQVLSTFAELHERYGFASLFISHNLAVVSQLCERVVVMRSGNIVEDGARRAVLSRPTDPYTRALIAAAPVADPREQRARRKVRLLGDPGRATTAADRGAPTPNTPASTGPTRQPPTGDLHEVTQPPPGRNRRTTSSRTTSPKGTSA